MARESGSLSDSQSSLCVLFFCPGAAWVISLILGLLPTFTCRHLGSHFRLNELYNRILIISSSPLCLLTPLFLETLLVGNGQILLESDRQKAPSFMGDPRCQYRKNFALGQGLNYPGDSCLDKGGQVLGTPVRVLTVVWPLPSSLYP